MPLIEPQRQRWRFDSRLRVPDGSACRPRDEYARIAVTHRQRQSLGQHRIAPRLSWGPIVNKGLRTGPDTFRQRPGIARCPTHCLLTVNTGGSACVRTEARRAAVRSDVHVAW